MHFQENNIGNSSQKKEGIYIINSNLYMCILLGLTHSTLLTGRRKEQCNRLSALLLFIATMAGNCLFGKKIYLLKFKNIPKI